MDPILEQQQEEFRAKLQALLIEAGVFESADEMLSDYTLVYRTVLMNSDQSNTGILFSPGNIHTLVGMNVYVGRRLDEVADALMSDRTGEDEDATE